MVADVTAPGGSIDVTTTEPGWLRIPDGLSAEQASAWVEAVAGELREAWGESWDDRAESMVPAMLADSIEHRPDAHVVLEAWPVVAPARARLSISIVDRSSVPEWLPLGFDVMPYEGAAAGPGIVAMRRGASAPDDDESVPVVEWAATFDDGERALVAVLDPVPTFFFPYLAAGLHGVVSSIEVTLSDGSPFRAAPSPLALVDDDAEWTSLRMRAEGLEPEDERADGEAER